MSSRGSSPLMLSSSPYQRDLDSRYARAKRSFFRITCLAVSCLIIRASRRSMQNSMETSLVSAGDTSFFNGSW